MLEKRCRQGIDWRSTGSTRGAARGTELPLRPTADRARVPRCWPPRRLPRRRVHRRVCPYGSFTGLRRYPFIVVSPTAGGGGCARRQGASTGCETGSARGGDKHSGANAIDLLTPSTDCCRTAPSTIRRKRSIPFRASRCPKDSRPRSVSSRWPATCQARCERTFAAIVAANKHLFSVNGASSCSVLEVTAGDLGAPRTSGPPTTPATTATSRQAAIAVRSRLPLTRQPSASYRRHRSRRSVKLVRRAGHRAGSLHGDPVSLSRQSSIG